MSTYKSWLNAGSAKTSMHVNIGQELTIEQSSLFASQQSVSNYHLSSRSFKMFRVFVLLVIIAAVAAFAPVKNFARKFACQKLRLSCMHACAPLLNLAHRKIT
jgi:hypothetical protein